MKEITHNQIVQLLLEYGVTNAISMNSEAAQSELIRIFKDESPDDYEAVANENIDFIVETAFQSLSEEPENYDEFNKSIELTESEDISGDINVDPLIKAKDKEESEKTNGSKDSRKQNDNEDNEKLNGNKDGGKPNNSQRTTSMDITADLASSLPSKAKDKIKNSIKKSWSEIVKKSNNSKITAFAIDTPVKDFLVDKTFIVDERKANDFLKKWDDKIVDGKVVRKVVDDNIYNDKGDIVTTGDNMKAFAEIKKIVQNDRKFDVRVPLNREQKVIGVIIGTIDGSGEEKVVPTRR